MRSMRNSWTNVEISTVYHQPFLDLLLQAQHIHGEFHGTNEVQMCRLLSIKTGACPESLPINMLVHAEGTPPATAEELDPLIMVRTIAAARILMPRSIIRLAGGRAQMTRGAVLLCFLAGSNSIFCRDKLLTTPNPAPDQGLKRVASFAYAY